MRHNAVGARGWELLAVAENFSAIPETARIHRQKIDTVQKIGTRIDEIVDFCNHKGISVKSGAAPLTPRHFVHYLNFMFPVQAFFFILFLDLFQRSVTVKMRRQLRRTTLKNMKSMIPEKSTGKAA